MDVDIARAEPDRLEDNGVHQTDGRRLFGALQQLLQRYLLLAIFVDDDLDAIDRVNTADQRLHVLEGELVLLIAIHLGDLGLDRRGRRQHRLDFEAAGKTQILQQT